MRAFTSPEVMVFELLRYYARALTALGTPSTSGQDDALLQVTKSPRRVTHMGYDVPVSPSM